MLFNLFYSMRELFFGFNIFKYITFRAAFAAITAFIISIMFGNLVVELLRRFKLGQQVRSYEDAPKLHDFHQLKKDTPTMGGILIILAVGISTLLWADLSNGFIILCLVSMTWLGLVGFVDDFLKIKNKKSKGLSARAKIISQVLLGLVVGVCLYLNPNFSTKLDIPFFKNMIIYLDILFIPFVILVVTGTSNAVNLTDGLDGLAIGCVTIVAFTYTALSYVTGHVKFSEYLNIVYVPYCGEIAVFCAALVGAGLGFLWFNSYPANVFMGDTGSLALGGAIGVVSVLIKKEVLLLIIGGIFVFEALSVIMQIFSLRIFKRRIFLMSPFHHHLQLSGWSEPKIIIRLWIVAIVLALFSLATLKIR